MSPWSALAWTLAGLGAPVAGTAVAAGTTALLAPRLEGLDHPWTEAARLAGKGHLYAGLSVAGAVRRAWWPIAAAAAIVSRRGSLGVLRRGRRSPRGSSGDGCALRLDPVRWTAVRLADDVAYGAGVWRGCCAGAVAGRAEARPDLVAGPSGGDRVSDP